MTTYRTEYESELIGPLTLASDGEAIVGCWFGNDRYFGYGVDDEMEPNDDLPVFNQACAWRHERARGSKLLEPGNSLCDS